MSCAATSFCGHFCIRNPSSKPTTTLPSSSPSMCVDSAHPFHLCGVSNYLRFPTNPPSASQAMICQSIEVLNGPDIFNTIYVKDTKPHISIWKSREKYGNLGFKFPLTLFYDSNISAKWVIESIYGKFIFDRFNYPFISAKVNITAKFGSTNFDVTLCCFETSHPTSTPSQEPTSKPTLKPSKSLCAVS